MVVPCIALTAQRRNSFRIASSFIQLILSVSFFLIFVLEFFLHLESLKYGIQNLLIGRLLYLVNKSIILMICSVPLFLLHVFQIQLLLKQTEKRSQLSFKQLTEFIMLSATAIAFVVLMFMFSLSYAGRFRKALNGVLTQRLILSNTTERDRIQNQFFCCGVHSYRDYLPDGMGYEESDESPALKLEVDVAPYHCQKATFQERLCVAPLSCCLQPQCSTLVPYFNGASTMTQWYRKTGCLEAIAQSYKYQLSSVPMTIFLFIILLLELASVLSLQITLSSFTLLKEANLELTCDSFGWLLPIGYPNPEELLAEMQTPGQNKKHLEEGNVIATEVVKDNHEKEETKKSVFTELNNSVK